MGLDQYLYKKTHVKQWEHLKDNNFLVTVERYGAPVPHIKSDRISTVVEQVGYWRKSNQIHRWFVENIQDGKDDCGEYIVNMFDLKQLLTLCSEVKNNPSKVEELLPTTTGFFFGGLDYAEWYFQDIDYTIETLESVISECENSEDFIDIYYSSSW